VHVRIRRHYTGRSTRYYKTARTVSVYATTSSRRSRPESNSIKTELHTEEQEPSHTGHCSVVRCRLQLITRHQLSDPAADVAWPSPPWRVARPACDARTFDPSFLCLVGRGSALFRRKGRAGRANGKPW
jgi:hypothetical protein